MHLPIRRIGPFEVSCIGLGCMNLSHAYGEAPAPEAGARLLNRALDLGCSFLDTAAIYGMGENERLLGRAVMHRRSEFTLATKCVMFVEGSVRKVDGRPEAIKFSVEQSLRRLGTDVIDLCYMHRLDKSVPIEDSFGALADLHAEGKIRAAGVSEMSAATIRRAHAVFPVTAVQSEYSPWVRNPEVAVLETCRSLEIAFVAFSPVGRGFLADSISSTPTDAGDIRAGMPRFVDPNLTANLRILDEFRSLAAEVGCTPAQLSLAWVLTRDSNVVPIPGTRSIDHLEENMRAASVELSHDVLVAVDRIFFPGRIQGTRYPPKMQRTSDTELLPEEAGSEVFQTA